MSLPGGYAGKILRVNLSKDEIKQTNTPVTLAKNYIGGKGFAAKMLYEEVEQGLDPLDPKNHLIIGVGPLTGTTAPSAGKFVICSKSPLTNIFGNATAGSDFGPELKFAGYDAVDIYGKAKNPVYLSIKDNQVELRGASHLWGKDVFETGDIISHDSGNEKLAIIAIGQAGENSVSFANVVVASGMKGRAAGRCGMGAVMGSKNLKAIAVQGSKDVTIVDPQKFENAVSRIERIILEDPEAREWTKLGTPILVERIGYNGALVTRNYQSGTFENAGDIGGKKLRKDYTLRNHACLGCRIACGKIVAVKRGPFKGLITKNPEFETLSMLGSNCGIGKLDVIIKAAELCDRLGLDTISTGNVIAFAIECFRRGLISVKQTTGLSLNWGDSDLLLRLIQDIAFRRGFGKILAEGVKKASAILGKETEYYAIHVKGLELIGGDPRGQYGFGLGYATCSRGGDHLGAIPCFEYTDSFEMAEKLFGDRDAGTRLGVKGKGSLIKLREDICNVTDSLVTCKTLFQLVSEYVKNPMLEPETWAELYSLATGILVDEQKLMQVGERITNLMRAFNVREGITRKDDTLPERVLHEPLPDGATKGVVLDKKKFNEMLDEYYVARKWDITTGIPSAQKLKELELDWAVDDLTKP